MSDQEAGPAMTGTIGICQIAEGIEILGFDIEGLNGFLKSERALLPGIAVLVMGPAGDENVAIVSGEPVVESILATADTSLQRAAVIIMSTYYDMRHVSYLVAHMMADIAASRGLTPADEITAGKIKVDPSSLPHGDIPVMSLAGEGVAANLNWVIGRAVYREKTA